MKRLIYIAILLVACKGNPVNEPEFQPYQIGDWKVVSEIESVWNPQSKAKTDTIKSANGRKWFVTDKNNRSQFSLVYSDSTQANIDFIAQSDDNYIKPILNDNGQPIYTTGFGLRKTVQNGIINIEAKMAYTQCGNFGISAQKELLEVVFRSSELDSSITYAFRVEGITPMLNALVCRSN